MTVGIDALSGISGDEMAAQLVRVPRHLKADNSGKASFDGVLRKAVEGAGDRPAERGKQGQDKKLMDACVEMESIFVARMLKEMRKTVHKSEWLHGGFAEEIFEDMLYDEYALSLSKNSNLGLAKMLFGQLSQKR